MSKLIVGLGNPGKKFEGTRHNIGMDVLDKYRLSWDRKFKGQYACENIKGERTHFIKPETFMNLSGESVVPLINFYKIEIEDVLVVHDELDLPFGTMTLKPGGGLAGHNGLKSIAQLAGTQDFMRLRMGIGRPERGSVSSWVLSRYDKDDTAVLENFLDLAARAIDLFIEKGFEAAAREYSKQKIPI